MLLRRRENVLYRGKGLLKMIRAASGGVSPTPLAPGKDGRQEEKQGDGQAWRAEAGRKAGGKASMQADRKASRQTGKKRG